MSEAGPRRRTLASALPLPSVLPPSPADAWAHLDAFLAEHVPALAADLAAPASEADIQILADTVGSTTTEPFAALYRFHDGQQSPTPGLFFGLQFLSSAEAAQEWERWAEQLRDDPALVTDIEASAVPEGTVHAVYASGRWVPFASDGAGNHLAIDLDPGPDGTPGQVISFGVDEATRFLLAPSAAAFVGWCAHQCAAGHAEVAPDPDAPGGLGIRLRGGRTLFDALPSLFGTK